MATPKNGPRPNRTDANNSRTIKPLWQVEKEAILSALKKLNGNKPLTASKLAIGKTTLYRKLREHGIRVEERRRVVKVTRIVRTTRNRRR